jgi:catechol 2,3-dioxygenase-like lactoylglutathione lyase family enzyme
MNAPKIKGCHHIGLTVSKLEESAAFFTKILDWKEVKRDPEYPAIFVSDGTIMVTLWQSKEGENKERSNKERKNKVEPTAFNKNQNIGLHHVAFTVESEKELNTIHEKLQANKVIIEFEPELLREGPAKHMMCYEPSGIRMEFIYLGN